MDHSRTRGHATAALGAGLVAPATASAASAPAADRPPAGTTSLAQLLAADGHRFEPTVRRG